MVKASFWTQEFVEEIVEALDESMGIVAPEELQSQPGAAAQWEKARTWRNEAKYLLDHPASGDVTTNLPDFPLSGKELRALQSVMDRIKLAHPVEGSNPKIIRIVNGARAEDPATVHGKLLRSLMRVRRSSEALAVLLVAICGLNIAEWFIFRDADFQLVFVFGILLSGFSLALWWAHHRHITEHIHLFNWVQVHVRAAWQHDAA